MKIYNYNKETKQFISQTIANPNPLEVGEYLIPANATTIEVLPHKDGFKIVFDEELKEWEYLEIPTIYVYEEETNEYLKSHKDTFLVDFKKFNLLEQETIKEPLSPKDGYAVCFNGAKWEYVEDNRNTVVYNKETKQESKIDYLGVIKDDVTTLKPEQFDKWDYDNNVWILDLVVKDKYDLEIKIQEAKQYLEKTDHKFYNGYKPKADEDLVEIERLRDEARDFIRANEI